MTNPPSCEGDTFAGALAETQLTIPYQLRMQDASNPDHVALTAPGRESLTYSGLAARLEAGVQTLSRIGLGRGDRVAIVLPNGPEMAVAFLTVATCATSAPLNPDYDQDELDFYLTDLNARAVIVQAQTGSSARTAAQKLGLPIIELFPVPGAEAGVFELDAAEGLPPARLAVAQPDDTALLLHTSGTTSRPKIVPLTHRNLCTSAYNARCSWRLSAADRCLNVMPLFHLHGLAASVLASLVAGASVVCTPGFDARAFYAWLEDHAPTWYTAVPTMHQALLKHAPSNHEIIARRPLRFIRSTSAALPSRVMAELEAVFGAPAVESYGLTEAPHTTSNPLPPLPRKPGSAGLPIGPEVAIMGPGGSLLPHGETGEIVIRGVNVTPGYENNPKANARSFVEGWLRTGDQGRVDGDGYLFITGRTKEIINRGGEKVAPREVDDILLEHPDLEQVVTFATPHVTLGEDVAAAVVLRENASVTEREIQRFAFSRLADYKVPSQIVIVDDIPKGPTGKLQRIGLADLLAAELDPEFEAPATAAEIALAEIWEEVLGLQRVGALDNFFALGGDSLTATQVVSRACARFQVELPLQQVFREPTLVDLAASIEGMILDKIESLNDKAVQSLVQ